MDTAALIPHLEAPLDHTAWKTRLQQALQNDADHQTPRHDHLHFASAYREDFSTEDAIQDIKTLSAMESEGDIATRLYRPDNVSIGEMNFKVFRHQQRVELSDAIPILEHLGLRVVGEHPYRIRDTESGELIWLHDFNLSYRLAGEVDVEVIRNSFEEAFAAIWGGRTESDGFNRLILSARLNWREVGLLRAYARYIKQTGFSYSQRSIADTLVNHREITRNLVALFKSRFDPRLNNHSERDPERIERLQEKVLAAVDQVENLNEDRIIRRYLDMMMATLRTNFFQNDSTDANKDYISLKFSPRQITDIPEPKPLFEIFVYSPRVEGVHLRGGKVARGGLRWSDRLEDYRTEVLGLVKAQQVKNAVIVPSGAKGGFVAKQLPESGDREAWLKEGVACYQTFIRGLLDLTDNRVNGDIIAPLQVVCQDEEDPYLVVAADKGTASFSDIANGIAAEYRFWLGDAFASGGSQGYDHKGMGITARGAWVSVQRHFRELGVNVQTDAVTAIGIGDMGGDVFGNGMLLSESLQLVAAFNHQHIFIDPDPDVAASFAERQRLFQLPRSSWKDYRQALISEGGGIFSRLAKSIAVTPQIKARFEIQQDRLTPTELIQALLKAPVDLIWNGGIGTYVKAESESNAEVGDKANDALRVNGKELRCKVFGEGGNLGLTQRGRVEFCLQGGACNTDFIDNAAGVDCSDHEVNIKILLNDVIAKGELAENQRNQLLADMTEAVSALVLKHNYRQTQALTQAQQSATTHHDRFCRFISMLESEGRLDRALEHLPADDLLMERHAKGKPLTRPELSVLISYAKVMLKEQLLAAKLSVEDTTLAPLASAFPAVLQQRFSDKMASHILRDEIVATQVANELVDTMGICFCADLMRATGASAAAVALAYMAARDIYQLEAYRSQVEALDYHVSHSVQSTLLKPRLRMVRRATQWLLRHHRGPINMAHEVESLQPLVQQLLVRLPDCLGAEQQHRWQVRLQQLREAGVPEPLAREGALPADLYTGLSVVDVARQSGVDLAEVLELLLSVGDSLGLHALAGEISALNVENYWQGMARETYRDELENQLQRMVGALLKQRSDNNASDTIESWRQPLEAQLQRWHTMLAELKFGAKGDFALVSVALRELQAF